MPMGFKSATHALNHTLHKDKLRNKRQPVKRYAGDELAKIAMSMGMTVSTNAPVVIEEDVEIVEVDVNALPEHLRRLVKD
jgi:hypothetical protein